MLWYLCEQTDNHRLLILICRPIQRWHLFRATLTEESTYHIIALTTFMRCLGFALELLWFVSTKKLWVWNFSSSHALWMMRHDRYLFALIQIKLSGNIVRKFSYRVLPWLIHAQCITAIAYLPKGTTPTNLDQTNQCWIRSDVLMMYKTGVCDVANE